MQDALKLNIEKRSVDTAACSGINKRISKNFEGIHHQHTDQTTHKTMTVTGRTGKKAIDATLYTKCRVNTAIKHIIEAVRS